MMSNVFLFVLGVALIVWGVKKLNEPLSREEIERCIAADDERIRKYIEEKEKDREEARRLKKERQ